MNKWLFAYLSSLSSFLFSCDASLKESHHVQFIWFQDAVGSRMNNVLTSGWDMSDSLRPDHHDTIH